MRSTARGLVERGGGEAGDLQPVLTGKPTGLRPIAPEFGRIMPHMPRGLSLDLSAFVLIGLAVVATGVAYWKDPGLPLLGAKSGLGMVWFILPRLIPALILAGMLQVIIPEETVARYFGRQSGIGAILMASAAGVITPGGPMVSVPLLVVLANSGMALGPLVAYMTSWSLFGVQRIIAWEAPLMGWRFVFVRVVPSLAFPVIAGWLVKLYYHE